MRIAVTGATGFLGSGLCDRLTANGHEVVPLARSGDGPRWDPHAAVVDTRGPVDAVVHLAGHPIAVRWTAKNRHRIMDSRVHGTDNLCRALVQQPDPPHVIVCASAVGWYGHTGDRPVDEADPRGDGFLADVVQAWEGAPQAARERGLRVVQPRFGVVLSPHGGALAKMLPAFRLGVGGPLGDGQQFLAWIHYDDLMAALVHLLESDLEGPVNVVAPEEVRFEEFAAALGRALHRPTFLRVPAPAVRLLFGDMGRETLLQGQRVVPRRLAADGFQWRHPELEEALQDLLG